MSCTIVVGGQFGSEGKGKIVALLALHATRPWVIRCGGPNSGHTTNVHGREVVVRQVPAGVANPEALLGIAAGCVVDENLLLSEMELLGVEQDRLIVDPRAVLLQDSDIAEELAAAGRIGSTASGTGAALVRRMKREHGTRLAGDSQLLAGRARIEPLAPQLHDALADGGEVIVEGTQGFGLSLLHSPHYPFVTARDTTAMAFASEVGLAPSHVSRVCVVVRTFPIRVGGNSGPLSDELDWDLVRELSGAPDAYPELTSVTKRVRRVGRFDAELVAQACQYNGATDLAVMGFDRLDYANTGVSKVADLSLVGRRFLKDLEQSVPVPVSWIGTGFGTMDAIQLDAAASLTTRRADVAR